MTTILIADGKITNPQYGKLGPVTSDGFSRNVSDIFGTLTDCEFGGQPISWSAVSAGIEANACWRTEGGLFRPVKLSGFRSICLDYKFSNFELRFNVARIDENLASSLFVDLLRQLDSTATYRLEFKQSEISFLYRTRENTVERLGAFQYAAGDLVTYTHNHGQHTVRVNNVIVLDIKNSSISAGYVGVSRGGLTASSGVIYLDNFVLYNK